MGQGTENVAVGVHMTGTGIWHLVKGVVHQSGPVGVVAAVREVLSSS